MLLTETPLRISPLSYAIEPTTCTASFCIAYNTNSC
uniref:Uncharacterized protein n=1 Tax=Anguilla anguilla TaxID=7936 RepID=A0A0E9TBG8_ANGAN